MQRLEYEPISYPHRLPKDQATINRSQITLYFNWFMRTKDARMNYLWRQVFGDRAFTLDKSVLQSFEYYLRENEFVRIKTPMEIERERNALPIAIKEIHRIPDFEIVEPSISICFDISIYWGELMKSTLTRLEWGIENDDEMAKYGYPYLKFPKHEFSFAPLWVLQVLQSQMRKHTTHEGRLMQLHDIWLDLLNK